MIVLLYIAIYFIVMYLIFGIIDSSLIVADEIKDSKLNKKRLKLLKDMAKEDKSSKEKVTEFADPIINNLFPKLSSFLPSLKGDKLSQLQKDIELAEWDDLFNAYTFTAVNLLLKIIGLILLIIAAISSGGFRFASLVWGAILIILPKKWLYADVESKKESLFNGFPDFIRITSGFLTANFPLVESIERSIDYVNDDWKPLLQKFIIEANTLSVDEALENMRDAVDLFEVKEFIALIRLTLEQGGEAKKGFLEQADRINDMKQTMLLKKIGQREVWATLLQMPLMLCSILIVSLPTIANVGNVFSMQGM